MKPARLAEILEKQSKAFHAILILLGILFALVARVRLPWHAFDDSLDSILVNISAALFVIAGVSWLRTLFYVNRDRIEIDKRLGAIEQHVADLRNSASLGVAYSHRDPYYDRYFDIIKGAEKQVHIVGDGFACHSRKNLERAEGLRDAMKAALDKGVTVRRFQFNSTLSIKWIEMMIQLKNSYADSFQVYINQSLDPIVVPYVICLTDHGSRHASVNIMFTIPNDTILPQNRGGPGFIFENNPLVEDAMSHAFGTFFHEGNRRTLGELRSLRDRFLLERRAKIHQYLAEGNLFELDSTQVYKIGKLLGILDVELIEKESLDWLRGRSALYFAYGSNLKSQRIRRRAPSATFIGQVTLDDWRLGFNIVGKTGEGEGGGIGNLIAAPQRVVHGFLFSIEGPDFEKLIKIEESMGYEVKEMTVQTAYGVPIPRVSVFVGDGSSREYRPTSEYFELITQGLRERGVEPSYIARLEEHVVRLSSPVHLPI